MPVYSPLSKPFKVLSLRNYTNRTIEWLFIDRLIFVGKVVTV